ncbi:hypothetical protein TrVE_jg7274 [Triparma verrucosa]|uniref:Uncharacterized protein n=1 Tax=Triparma verrucosa TaxID=1606542 RepID=A0A9W7C2Q8_9STRA|nr:hypothetical protein TrVE_jg7274 [Triparma verrucosa]
MSSLPVSPLGSTPATIQRSLGTPGRAPTSPARSNTTTQVGTPNVRSSAKPLEPPLPPPKNTTPIKISKSLVGKEWEDKKRQRNEKLAKRLEEEEQKTLTFSPSINRYHLPDRTADDVLENMNRKEKLRQVRLDRLRDARKQEEPNFPFKPQITIHSSTPMDGEPVLDRMDQEHEMALLELEKKKFMLKNFDTMTGQKFFEPVINSGRGDYGKSGWRSEQSILENGGGSTPNSNSDNKNTLDVSEIDSFKDSVMESEDDDSNELARTLGTPPEHDSNFTSSQRQQQSQYQYESGGATPSKGEMASKALYKDADDRKQRLKDMLDYVEDVHKSKSAIGHLSARSGKLAKKNMERKLFEAFNEMSSDEAKEFITRTDVLNHLIKYKESGYINILLFLKDGEDLEEDLQRVCGEMADEIFSSFQATASSESSVVFPDFLRVASACCIGALSSGYSTKDELDHEKDGNAAATKAPMTDDGTPVGTSKSPVYMYPRKNRNFKEKEEADQADGGDEAPAPPQAPTTPSSPNHSSLPFSKATIYFCRASIRSVTINHTKRLLAKEEEQQYTFEPALCAKSLEMDKRKHMEGREVSADNRIDMMQVKKKMQEVKLKQKREEKVKKEREGCTFRPKITKFKFNFAKKGQGDGKGEDTIDDVFVDSSNGDEEEEQQQQQQFVENGGKHNGGVLEQGLMPPKGIEGEEDSVAEIEEERQQTVQFQEEEEELLGGGSKENPKPKPGHVVVRSVRFRAGSGGDEDLENGLGPLSPKANDDEAAAATKTRTLSMDTNGTADTSSASRQSIRGWDGPIEVADYLSQPAFDRLYNRRPHPEKMEHKKSETDEERKLRECTFTPKINKGTRQLVDRKKRRNTWFGTYESPEGKASWGKLTEVDHEKNGLVPKNFEKDISRQKKANQQRNKARDFQENGGYTDETWKAAKEKYDAEGVKPFSFLTGERENTRRETKLFMDIKLSKGKKGRIGICDFDKPRNLARTFARTYSLNKETENKLTKVIKAYMEANDILVGGVNVRVTMNSDGEEEENKEQEGGEGEGEGEGGQQGEWGRGAGEAVFGESKGGSRARAKTTGLIRSASSPMREEHDDGGEAGDFRGREGRSRAKTTGILRSVSSVLSSSREGSPVHKEELDEGGGGAEDFWNGGLRSRRASS